MKATLNRCRAFIVCALFFQLSARAQFIPPEAASADSTSGQFTVIGGQAVSPLASQPAIIADTNLVRLEPALLAVSAERVKESFRREIGISRSAPWSGKIFLALHPARSSDEEVTIISSRFGGVWNYRVEMPDIISQSRLSRALTGVLLLEFANRSAESHSAEIPPWLTEGLSQQLSAAGSPENILQLPNKIVNNIAVMNSSSIQRGVDPLAGVRQVLRNSPALTFEQLSWPDDAQLSGDDGGAFHASAHLFVGELLKLNDGAADLRAMLQSLPQFYNWQTAFQEAFKNIFPTPLDVEKWWALRVVDFASHDSGPQWTPSASRDKLDDILTVPIEMRGASNDLPAHAEISLQGVVRNFDFQKQNGILQTKLRDLELAQLQMSPQLSALTDNYRHAVQDFLEKKSHADATMQKLDALDAQRRTIEDTIKPDVFTPRDLNASVP